MPRRTGTLGLFPSGRRGWIVADVEGLSIAHALPELYRVVLERVASLEFLGHRDEALLIRREAVRAYSRAWDQRALARMATLRARAEHLIDGAARPRALVPTHPAPRATPRRSTTA